LTNLGCDLYCAGHIHGGQIALPWYGALVTLARFGKRFESGLYQVGSTALYVNRGIGMEGGAMPWGRFCAGPEITVIEIQPSPRSPAPAGDAAPSASAIPAAIHPTYTGEVPERGSD
jgi:hypothetical protein